VSGAFTGVSSAWHAGTDRFYVFIPLPLAAAIGLEAGEEFQWSLADRNNLAVQRVETPRAQELRAKPKKSSRK